jgi:hypothetical protein
MRGRAGSFCSIRSGASGFPNFTKSEFRMAAEAAEMTTDIEPGPPRGCSPGNRAPGFKERATISATIF